MRTFCAVLGVLFFAAALAGAATILAEWLARGLVMDLLLRMTTGGHVFQASDRLPFAGWMFLAFSTILGAGSFWALRRE